MSREAPENLTSAAKLLAKSLGHIVFLTYTHRYFAGKPIWCIMLDRNLYQSQSAVTPDGEIHELSEYA